MGFFDSFIDVAAKPFTGPFEILANNLGSEYKSTDPAEKIAALQKLLEFGQTGKMGNFTAGQQYGGALGNYSLTPTEMAATSALYSSLMSGTPQGIQSGDSALMSLYKNIPSYFDVSSLKPSLDSGILSAYRDQADLQTKRGFDAIKRNAGFAGNLYSTDTIRNMGDYQAQSNADFNSKFSDLVYNLNNNYMNLAANAKQNEYNATANLIPQFFNSATTNEGIQSSRIANAFNYGGLQRTVADSQAKDAYNAWLTSRGEYQTQLDAFRTLAGSSKDGYLQNSKWSTLLNALASIGGRVAGAAAGGK